MPFETPTPLPRAWRGDIHSTLVWKPVKFLDTRAKILSEVPVPWYSAVQTKVPCAESAVTAFFKSPRQTLKSISTNTAVLAVSYTNNLFQMFKLPIKWRENATTDKLTVNPPLIPRPVGQRSLKTSIHCASQGNTSWWIWGVDHPRFSPIMPGVRCVCVCVGR